jgi:hypothetical protein
LPEDLQFTFDEGPCMQAALTGNPVLVSDLQHGSEAARWPVLAAAATGQTAVRALFALPLHPVNVGVLDRYRTTPRRTVRSSPVGWCSPRT